MRKRRIFAAAAALPLAIAGMGIAYADNIQDNIVDTGTGVTLVAGSATGGTANIRVVGNNSQQDPDDGCNFDTAAESISISFVAPQGVTVSPQPLVVNACGTDYPITLKASANAASGTVTATYVNHTDGTFTNQVNIPVTVTNPNTKPSVTVIDVINGAEYVIGSVPIAMCDVTDAQQPNVQDFAAALSGSLVDGLGQQTATCNFTDEGGLAADTASVTYTIVAPPNTKPTVTVTGVTDGRSYEYGTTLTPGCAVTDAEDGTSNVAPVISDNRDAHGLGSLTVTCNATDDGGLAADTATATYTIVDTIDPTISHTVSGTASSDGWYKDDVTVTFTCADLGGSGIDTCLADGETTSSKTLGEGANQSVTGTATDWAGNDAQNTASGINIDETAPINVGLVGGPADNTKYFPNTVPAAPTCTATDSLSGVKTCVVTGYSSAVGVHTVTATATDKAGNVAAASRTYTVRNLTFSGFFAPVDKGIHNTIKGGNTVPLKFKVFDEGVEQIATSVVSGFSAKQTGCDGTVGEDAIEEFSSVASGLRYDLTAGNFIQNWKTPTKSGVCYLASVTLIDGTSISAEFKTK